MRPLANPSSSRRLWIWPVLLGLLVACAAPASPSAPAAKSAPAAPAATPPAAAPPAQSAPPAAQSAPAPSRGKQLLDELVRKANAEGELSVLMTVSWNHGLAGPLAEGFKKRFGLTSNVTVSPVLGTQHLPVAIAETRAGTPPTYDAVYGDEAEMMQLIGAGGTIRVEDWEALLAEVNPGVGAGRVKPDQISQGPLAGRGFTFVGNVKQILYNPRLISEAELPRRHTDLADPRYKDKFIQPPWTSHWEIAPAVLDNLNRDQWLDTVRAAGKNSAAVMPEGPAAERVVLGQYPFSLGQDTYIRMFRAKDPQAPLAARFFEDYNEYNALHYVVRAGTTRPAGATLWVLWMTTPDSSAIWQPTEYYAQRFGESDIDKAQRQLIQESGAPVVGLLDTPRAVELLEWYQTADGRQYLDSMQKAIRGE
jgi:ABC-type Fe3+ transport system substrate-binding protein